MEGPNNTIHQFEFNIAEAAETIVAEPWHVTQKKLLILGRLARDERLAKLPKGPGAMRRWSEA